MSAPNEKFERQVEELHEQMLRLGAIVSLMITAVAEPGSKPGETLANVTMLTKAIGVGIALGVHHGSGWGDDKITDIIRGLESAVLDKDHSYDCEGCQADVGDRVKGFTAARVLFMAMRGASTGDAPPPATPTRH